MFHANGANETNDLERIRFDSFLTIYILFLRNPAKTVKAQKMARKHRGSTGEVPGKSSKHRGSTGEVPGKYQGSPQNHKILQKSKIIHFPSKRIKTIQNAQKS